MTVTSPPRPSDPAARDDFDAIVEALIEEARQRARRRRRRYGAVAVLVALSVLAVATIVEGAAPSHEAEPGPAAGAGAVGSTANAQIAFAVTARLPHEPNAPYTCAIHVVNPDGSGQRRVARFTCGGAGLDWSPDGRTILFTVLRDGSEEFAVVDTRSSEQRILTDHPASDQGPRWSPDGRKIAFTRASYTSNDVGVYVIDAEGGSERELAPGWGPVWSPDGRKIAFAHSGDRGTRGNHGIYVMKADGSGKRELPAGASPEGSGDWPVAWSPDGKILFWRAVGRGFRGPKHIYPYIMNADGSGQRRLPPAGQHGWVWSPDARKIAYGDHGEIYVMNADGRGKRRLAHGSQPRWSPDGRMIAFRKARGGYWEIFVVNDDGTDERRLTRTRAMHLSLDWSPAR